jgi:hypothetical protein
MNHTIEQLENEFWGKPPQCSPSLLQGGIIYFLMFYLFISFNAKGQGDLLRRNAVYAEIYGSPGTVLSVNYERLVKIPGTSIVHLAFRVGFTVGKAHSDSTILYICPIEFNGIIGREKHFLELGIGYTPFFGTSNLNSSHIPEGYRTNFDYSYSLRVGYRLVKETRFILRLAPLIEFSHITPQNPAFHTWITFGASLGYCFNFKKKESFK